MAEAQKCIQLSAWKLNILENGHDSYAASYEIRDQAQFRELRNESPGQQLVHMTYEKKSLCYEIHNQVKLNTLFEPIEWAAVQMVEQQGHPRARALEGLVKELPPPGRAVEFALSWSPTKRSDVIRLRAVPYQHPCAKKSYITH